MQMSSSICETGNDYSDETHDNRKMNLSSDLDQYGEECLVSSFKHMAYQPFIDYLIPKPSL